jgi:small-conductance mechanosensitive channel
MYHIIFLILLFFSTYFLMKKQKKIVHNVLSFLLLSFVTLRYGQGSDYFSYIFIFQNSAELFETAIKTKEFSYLTQEIGFAAISYLWIKLLNFSPETLSALFSAVSFLLVWFFIRKYSISPIISLFIYYCTFYLIYPFSGIRQGICIGVFLLYLIPLLQERKYTHYYVISALLFTMHFSSVILFIIPIVNLVKSYKPIHVYLFGLIALLIGLLLHQLLFSFFSTLDLIGGKIEAYTETNSLDIISLLLRISILIPVMFTYKIYERESIMDLFLKIYIFGFFLYLIFMSSALISARLNVYMRHLEIILLVDTLILIFKKKEMRILSYFYIFAIMSVLYTKNINAFILQGPYRSEVNFFNYPYVSVFNKKDITELRQIPPFYQKFVIYEY